MGASARYVAHALWAASCASEYRAFLRSTNDVERVQRDLLLATVRRNAKTAFGREHGFDGVSTVEEFRERVPIVGYDDLAPFVARAAGGEPEVLTDERVRLFEPTGGSTSGTKLIPYTRSLAREFGRAIDTWIADLLFEDRGLWRGTSYWSVSPAGAARRRTDGGIPIGFEDDSKYLGVLQRRLLGRVLAVPPEVRDLESPDAFRYATLFHLVRDRNLTLVSVWNPTFFTILLDRLAEWGASLAEDVARGAPRAFGLDAIRGLEAPRDSTRAREIAGACRASADVATTATELWRDLRLVSCWADASAERPARALAAMLPHARMQAKGLLATEAFVSIPLWRWPAPALAVRSHFVELVPDGAGDSAALGAHEVVDGRRYSVVVTTGGGLYRYRPRDLVEVVGHAATCPLVRFVGKEDSVSDRFGEKVDERHADAVVRAAFEPDDVPRFAVLSCERHAGRHAYTLFVDAELDDQSTIRISDRLESGLAENFHYAYCRRLEQLGRARVVRVGSSGAEAFLDECRSRGQRLGDVKPSTLYAKGDLSAAIAGVGQTPEKG